MISNCFLPVVLKITSRAPLVVSRAILNTPSVTTSVPPPTIASRPLLSRVKP